MTTVTLFFFFFLFISCLSCGDLMASLPQRRMLHQPLISPQKSSPPNETQHSPPFFPTDPPPPPPPENVPDSSSSPVNITSLQLPSSSSSSSSSSHTHLVLIAAAASAVILVAALVFYFFRRRKLYSISTDNQKEKPFPPPSSIYYMNPDAVCSMKIDSPELRPLPHLPGLSFTQTHQKDEEEVFYSPKSTGSASKRTSSSAAAVAAVEKSGSRRNGGGEDEGSCSSFSSSSSPPPSSVTISPPSRRSSNSPLEKKVSSPSPSEKEEDVGIVKTVVAAPPPPAPPLGLFQPSAAEHGVAEHGREAEASNKPKLKALHWDKVKATSDREMVWDQLKSSSFKVNEEMMESLFVANSSGSKSDDFIRRSGTPCGNQEMRVLDPKKAQNVSILIRALNVTVEEVREALLEGNEVGLGRELLECLLKMAPTKEEERKLKECGRDVSARLGPAERFLKAIIDIPFAFRRIDALVYVVNFEHEVEYLTMSYKSLQRACEDLRNNKTFLRLLEAVLKTGNRMNVGTNRGEASAFKLDTLLKLVDVKGIDGKTTLLHFVVKEMIKSEGGEKSGLKLVSSLTSELESVRKAAAMDSEVLSGEVRKLRLGIEKMEEVVEVVGGGGFREWMRGFVKMAEGEIIKMEEEERVAICKVKEITEYFHGNMSREEAHPFRIFMVVRDFLLVLDRICKEMGMINTSRFM